MEQTGPSAFWLRSKVCRRAEIDAILRASVNVNLALVAICPAPIFWGH